MKTSEKQVSLINALKINEVLMSDLYKVYAQKFPPQQDFWTHIAHDEITHAEWIQNLLSEIENGLFINDNRFKIEPINIFSEFVRGNIDRAKKEELKLITALSISIDVEKGLIESKFFEVYETDDVRLKNVLTNLERATEVHLKMVKDAWIKEKQSVESHNN